MHVGLQTERKPEMADWCRRPDHRFWVTYGLDCAGDVREFEWVQKDCSRSRCACA